MIEILIIIIVILLLIILLQSMPKYSTTIHARRPTGFPRKPSKVRPPKKWDGSSEPPTKIPPKVGK